VVSCGITRRQVLNGPWVAVIKQILIVCVGNVCRSPMAEHLFRRHLSPVGIQVESAGLGALAGRAMDATALQLLAERGVDGTAHRARQLSVSMIRSADLILAMEREHMTQVMRLVPESRGKLMLLDCWESALDIPDPFRQSREAFEHVAVLIDRGVRRWLKHVPPLRSPEPARDYVH